MARLEREPKNPGRAARAELVRAATLEDWQARPGARLEKTGRDGTKLVVAKAPDYIYDADGEIIGVDAWVQLFDEQGRELKIDPHRRIINPPTVPRASVQWADTGRATELGESIVERRIVNTDPAAAFWETVWDSIESAPNPRGWRTRGTVTTVFSSTADGEIQSLNSSYSPAREGTGSFTVNTTDGASGNVVGQLNGVSYICWDLFVSFDTSAINDGDVVSSVDLDMWHLGNGSIANHFSVEARERDWGPTLTSADWVAGSSLSGLTLMASLATSGVGGTGAYATFASETAFLTATNLKTGVVYLDLSSSRRRTGTEPPFSQNEQLGFALADTSGTSQDPKLTITHEAGGSAPFFTSRPNRIWRLG